ncbi:hypothetical protein JNK62_04755 [bacterium]|nr:hypothetical protein [bacterium]
MDASELPKGETKATVIYKESSDNIIVQFDDGRRMQVSCAALYIQKGMSITLIVGESGFWISYKDPRGHDTLRAAKDAAP